MPKTQSPNRTSAGQRLSKLERVGRLRISAIGFLNPAPLLYDFEHSAKREALAERYDIHYTLPSNCAHELAEGEADLGLIPIAALATIPDLLIVPGCTIASLRRVRSIQIVSRVPLDQIRTLAADTSSRSSVAYAKVLFRHFLGTDPEFRPHAPLVDTMLEHADAALLIGDPALIASESHPVIEMRAGQGLYWYDVAEEWTTRTGLPWVAAIWALRAEALAQTNAALLIDDLNASRDAGLAHIEDLVTHWKKRIAVSPQIIRTYLTENIHYVLDERCIAAMKLFFDLAAATEAIPQVPELRFVE